MIDEVLKKLEHLINRILLKDTKKKKNKLNNFPLKWNLSLLFFQANGRNEPKKSELSTEFSLWKF